MEFSRNAATLAVAGALALAMGWLGGTPPAAANPFFATQTKLPCSGCHLPGQEQNGQQSLNATGTTFLQCGYKPECIKPAPAAPVQHTTEKYNGIARFDYACTNNQMEWVALRPGKNQSKRDIAVAIEPGNHVILGVSVGTTYASKCNTAPDNADQFYYLTLTEWVNPN